MSLNDGRLRYQIGLRAGLATLALLATTAGVRAQEDAPTAAPPQASPPAAEAAETASDPGSPRGAVRAYLVAGRAGDWKRASRYLDLSAIPREQREERGPVLARRLKRVLDRELWVDLETLSSQPGGDPDDGLPKRRDRVGTIQTRDGAVDVLVERVRDASDAPMWKFSARTVAAIPALYEEFGYGALGEILPPVFFESQLFEIQLWQWGGLLLIVLLAFSASWVVVRAVLAALRPLIERSPSDVDDRLLRALLGPLRLVVALLIFSASLYSLALAMPAERFFVGLEKIVGVLAVTWFTLRLIDLFGSLVETRLDERGQRAATSLVPLGRKTIKVLVVVLALFAALDSVGFNVTPYLAGLGIGGLAVALALQKTLENLFGGATLIADRPVQVGDFCRFSGQLGTIEEIGLRSTRVRTLDRTVVTVPNAEFATLSLENFAKRDKIWFNPRIGLLYDTTPDQMRYLLVEIRRMLYAHPKVDPDPARVRFTNFGAYSLDVDIFAYVLATDYSEYLSIAEDLNLRIMDIVRASGTAFAFPSNTTYLGRDPGVDEEKTRAAEQEVERWRGSRKLYLPGFPPDKIRELRGTLDFPDPGSP